MTREHRISKHQPPQDPAVGAEPFLPQGQAPLPKLRLSRRGSPTVPQVPDAPKLPTSPPAAPQNVSFRPKATSRSRPAGKPRPVPPPPPPGVAATASPRRNRFVRILSSWKLWVVLALLTTTGSGVFALSVLLHLPGLPNCPAIFWPLASASLRFECGRLAASKQTINDLLEAIALVDSLPSEHPLRGEADRLVELWSGDLLRLAEEAFHAGKMAEAIAAARRIPPKVSTYRLVEERVQRWQTIWSKAEGIYQQAESALRKLNWRQAFLLAVRLLDVDNTYWQTTKYAELNSRINAAREDGNKLGKAERLADNGGLENLLEAIKLAESIGNKSDVYEAAQTAIGKFGRRMITLAEGSLERRDLQTALKILGKIPDSAKLKEEVKDQTTLAYAISQTWSDTVAGLEDAISQAQKVELNRPLRKKAQTLIAQWQQEIEALAELDKARTLAQPGSLEDLRAAIAQASTIPQSNPRWSQAQKQIQTWTTEIQTSEDRPILDMAEQMAMPGDVASLQAAIAQANQIRAGRALYREAQTKVDQWTAQIQTIQDQPILDQARNYANAGDLTAAISTAEQIKSGRALHGEAQSEVRGWRKTIAAAQARVQAERTLQQARSLANAGTVDGLVEAIRVADQVASGTNFRSEADAAIADWSRQILQVAESQSGYDLLAAIATAQRVPSRSEAYAQAQQQIQTWRKLVQPVR